MLGGEFRPQPGDWVKFPVQDGAADYWFAGEHRRPESLDWRRDAAVGHRFDRFQNGTLSTVGWDDTGEDRDFDDLTMEVAVVLRLGYFGTLHPMRLSRGEVDRIEREVLPRVRSYPRQPHR